MNRSTIVVLSFTLCAATERATAVGSYLPPAPTRTWLHCDMQRITGRLETAPVGALRPADAPVRYEASGVCAVMLEGQSTNTKNNESTFGAVDKATVAYRFDWTATGRYEPKTGATHEELVAPAPRLDEPSQPGRPYGRFILDTRCRKNPWLEPASAACERPTTRVTGNLGSAEADLKFSGIPFTANTQPQQRTALAEAYQRAIAQSSATASVRSGALLGSAAAGALTPATSIGGRNTVERAPSTTVQVDGSTASGSATATLGKRKLPSTTNPEPSGGAGGSAAAAPTAPPPTTTVPAATPAAPMPVPQIVSPVAGVPQHAGQLRVQVKPVPGTESAMTELEFVWLAPRNGEAGDRPPPTPMPLRWQAPMAQLMQGLVVPANAGPSTSGRWQLRLHPVTAGAAWSAPAVFDFVADRNAAQAAAAANGNVPPQAKAWGRRDGDLERRGLNPQPLPPREGQPSSELSKRGLNPQPLPPKESTAPRSAFDRQQQP